MTMRYVYLTPRLSAALEMLKGYDTVADIGCDHGRLAAALLQSGACAKVIASDISKASLEKAKCLLDKIGLADRVSFRQGDGLTVLKDHECDAIAMLGMGGTLMCRILDAGSISLSGVKAIIFQPMRAQDDIRRYLYEHCYQIVEDHIILDQKRYYQIFKAIPGSEPEKLPSSFPEGFYDVGYRSFADRELLLPALCIQQLSFHYETLKSAHGSKGEKRLQEKIDALQSILKQIEKSESNETV